MLRERLTEREGDKERRKKLTPSSRQAAARKYVAMCSAVEWSQTREQDTDVTTIKDTKLPGENS